MKPTTLLTTKSRTGKIGRLPRTIRNELNQRLDNGEPAAPMLAWLNALPEVQTILATHFDATPITKQNLSQWHNGGFQEWLQQQECRDLLFDFAADSKELTGEDRPLSAAGYVSTLLVAQLARTARQATAQIPDPVERCQRLQELLLTLSRVRHQDYLDARLHIERERFETEHSMKEEPTPPPPIRPAPIQSSPGESNPGTSPSLARGRLVRSNVATSTTSNPPQAPCLSQPQNPASAPPAPIPPARIQSSPNESNPVPSSPLDRGRLVRSNVATSTTSNPPQAPCWSQPQNPAAVTASTNPLPPTPIHPVPRKPYYDDSYLSTIPDELPPKPIPHVPDPDPAKEAYNRWFSMNSGSEPFDYEGLQKLYAAIPPKPAPTPRSVGGSPASS
jgi:hypothetical protein